jgi:RNA polymerase sigma-70 factor (ECF subfamily)
LAWQGGDQRAGNKLLQRHFGSVYGFFANKIDEAEDLTQKTFLACVEVRDRFRESASFRSYLLGIARKQLLMHLRKRGRWNKRFTPQRSVEVVGDSPSIGLAQREEERLLLAALRHLPLDQQTLLELYYWEDMSLAEISDVVELPRGTIKSRLFRAREGLREVLSSMASANPELLTRTLDGLEAWGKRLGERLSATGT